MEFNLPTSKPEMYNILNELFNYYRIKREGYEYVEFKPLDLTRIEFSMPTDEQLREQATTLLASNQEREISEYKQNFQFKKVELEAKRTLLYGERETLVQEIEDLYEKSVKKVERQAVKNGLVSSGVLGDKITQLEIEKNQKISQIRQEYNDKDSSMSAQITVYMQAINGANDFFKGIHEKQIEEKMQALKSEYEKIQRDVVKFNSSQDEKEQRYDNTILQLNATIKVQFINATAGELTKDTLVEMGYYSDVIDCVCGYYNTLEAEQAFQDFSSDKKLPIYLDDYYQNILYMYASRAGY